MTLNIILILISFFCNQKLIEAERVDFFSYYFLSLFNQAKAIIPSSRYKVI